MSQPAHQRIAEFRRGSARYVPLGRLACGGMAEVWRGEAHFADGHVVPVAIKRVLPDLARNPLYRAMLEDEARIGMMLRHPNIVRVFDAREVKGTFILIMELVDGVTLRDVLGYLQARRTRLPVAAALHIARELARGLEHAHEAFDEYGRELHIVHRDVSPHNVQLGVDGRVKLMDFGLANSTANLAERDPAMIGGKLGYLAPEVVLQQQSSVAFDLFALGVMLWESVTGQRLFHGPDEDATIRNVARCQVPPPSRLVPELPRELDQLLADLLAADPAARHPSARDLGAELEYLLLRWGRSDQTPDEETAWWVRACQAAQAHELLARHPSSVSSSHARPIAAAPRADAPVPAPARPALVRR